MVPQLGLTKPLLSKLKLLKIILLALSFSFSQYLGLCVFFYFIISLFGDSENRENNYLKIRDLLSIALFNILGTHYLIHI